MTLHAANIATIDTLIPGLSTGLLELEEVKRFADDQLARPELSPFEVEWLAELSTAENVGAALESLWYARRRWKHDARQGNCGWKDAEIGFLALLWERGDLELPSLLRQLGNLLDGAIHEQFGCEHFFSLLTQLERASEPSDVAAELVDLIDAQRNCAWLDLHACGFTAPGEYIGTRNRHRNARNQSLSNQTSTDSE